MSCSGKDSGRVVAMARSRPMAVLSLKLTEQEGPGYPMVRPFRILRHPGCSPECSRCERTLEDKGVAE